MILIGLLLGILIGALLGLIGSGGSILTIPILVYVMDILPSEATTYSLFIVGTTSLVGAIKGAKDKLLDYKTALYFGVPSIISIYVMRKFLVPIFPEVFFSLGQIKITKDIAIMLLFSFLMIFASISMIKKNNVEKNQNDTINYNQLIFKGLFIGFLTGFIGVGGGFLIIPTLLYAARLNMRQAVATSLIIISFNSLMGFVGSINKSNINWYFLLEFTTFTVAGIFIGITLNKKINAEKLKISFGWFVLLTGFYIIIKQFF